MNAAWLQRNLAGRKVVFNTGGTEIYSSNGGNSFRAGGKFWNAPVYKFYDNGMRCIGYPTPRWDLYVVNGGKLHLINEKRERYAATIKK